MRIAYRLAIGLAVLIGLVLTGQPAQADAPSLSIDNITFTPGGGQVTQTVAYQNLPANSTIYYRSNVAFVNGAISGPAGTTCSYDTLQSFCSGVAGSGVIEVTYGGTGPGWDQYAYPPEQATITVSVAGSSLTATGTTTVTPAADLTLSVGETISGATIVVYNHGPSVSTAETLRITGLTSPIPVPSGACELQALDVVCYMHELSTTTDANHCNATSTWFTCYAFKLTIDVDHAPRLTFTVTGPLPDPDPSNNTTTLFGAAQPAPAPTSAGGTAPSGQNVGGRGSNPATTTISASTSAAASASPSNEPVNADAVPSTQVAAPAAVADANHQASGAGPVAVAIVVTIGLLAGAGLGGTGIFVAWRRLRPRPAGSPDANEPDIGA
jgi:hypothetical protein